MLFVVKIKHLSNKIGYLHGVKMIYLFKALNYMAAVIVNTHERKKPLMPFQSSFILWKTKCIKKIAHTNPHCSMWHWTPFTFTA